MLLTLNRNPKSPKTPKPFERTGESSGLWVGFAHPGTRGCKEVVGCVQGLGFGV